MTEGSVYNFRTIAPITLGDTYTSLRLIQTTLGLALPENIKVKLQLLSTKVSVETGDFNLNVEKERVMLFTDVNNNPVYLLEKWIEVSSIEEVNRVNLSITLSDLNTSDPDRIIELLNENGYKITNKKVTTL